MNEGTKESTAEGTKESTAAGDKSDFLTRLGAAIVLLIIAISTLWLGGYVYAAMLGLAGVLLLREWYELVQAMTRTASARIAVTVLGGLVAIVAVACLWLVRIELGFIGALWLFGMVWATDIGAYFAGRGFGGRLLSPKISPKKTWSGLGGGMVAALVVGATLGDRAGIVGVPLWIGLLVGLLAQMGDLFESWIKRRAGCKDSGRLIPGHGGLFDRVDGLLPVAIILGILTASGQLTRLAPIAIQS